MTKMTYAAALSHVLTTCEMPEEVRAKLVALSESLAKKASAEKKPTAQQVANQGVAEAIVATMNAEPTRLFTITELIKECPACADLTNQRVSAIVRGLIGVSVERVEEKRKAYFRALGV